MMKMSLRFLFCLVFSLAYIQAANALGPYNPNEEYCGPGGKEKYVPRAPDGVDFNYACYHHDKCCQECRENHKTQAECDEEFNQRINQFCDENYSANKTWCVQKFNGLTYPLRGACYANAYAHLQDCYAWSDTFWLAVAALSGPLDTFKCADGRLNPMDSGAGSLMLKETEVKGANFSIENITFRQDGVNLFQGEVALDIRNTGDSSGNARIKLFRGHYNESLINTQERSIAKNGTATVTFMLDMMSVAASPAGKAFLVTASVENDTGGIYSVRNYIVYAFAGMINGRVVDEAGKPLANVQVATEHGNSATTDRNGYYQLSDIRTAGKIVLTAKSPDFANSAETIVRLVFDESKKSRQDGLYANAPDIVMRSAPGGLTIDCRQRQNIDYFLANEQRGYAGSIESGQMISGILPGRYRLTVIVRGTSSESFDISLTAAQETTVQANCSNMHEYNDDRIQPGLAKKIWETDIGGNLYAAAIAKDGSAFALYVADPGREDSGTILLYGIDGRKRAEIPIHSAKGQQRSQLSLTFDGRKALFCLAMKDSMTISLFDQAGRGLAELKKPKNMAAECHMSQNGEYIYSNDLYDADLAEIDGQRLAAWDVNSKAASIPPIARFEEAMSPNLVIAQHSNKIEVCRDSWCEMTFDSNLLRRFAASKAIVKGSVSADRRYVALASLRNLNFYDGDQLMWSRDIEHIAEVSVSPGGKYLVFRTSSPLYAIHIYSAAGQDITRKHPRQQDDVMTAVTARATASGIYAITGGNRKAAVYVFGEMGEICGH